MRSPELPDSQHPDMPPYEVSVVRDLMISGPTRAWKDWKHFLVRSAGMDSAEVWTVERCYRTLWDHPQIDPDTDRKRYQVLTWEMAHGERSGWWVTGPERHMGWKS